MAEAFDDAIKAMFLEGAFPHGAETTAAGG